MSKITKARPSKATRVTFENLVGSIHAVHREWAAQASRAVNLSLTLRNWLIGCRIAEYELHLEQLVALEDPAARAFYEAIFPRGSGRCMLTAVISLDAELTSVIPAIDHVVNCPCILDS